MLSCRHPGAARGAGPSTPDPHAGTYGWFKVPAASHRLPQKPILRGVAVR